MRRIKIVKIYISDSQQNPNNCLYPHEVQVDATLKDTGMFEKDYVCVAYKGNYRSNENFIETDCLSLDLDNDHSNDPTQWITPEDVFQRFAGVEIAIHYSRNHMKQKGEKSPRPRFHVLMHISKCVDAKEYSDLKRRVNEIFPFFDRQALDAARFFFGTPNPKVELSNGTMTLNDFLEEEEFDQAFDKRIGEGSRNSTMSRFASRILKKYGDTEDARTAFDEMSTRCDPPLATSELNAIWHSALKFYKEKVLTSKDYKPPEEFNDTNSYKPTDFSDVAQAEVFSKYFSGEVRYSKGTLFIKYRGNRWVESEAGAQASVQELTRRQLKEAKRLITTSYKSLSDSGGLSIALSTTKAKVEGALNEEQRKAYRAYMDSLAYEGFVIKRRDSHYISATLRESRPMVEIETSDLDCDPFLLNTPNGTYDLRRGLGGLREHRSEDLITKITNYAPSTKGKDVWDDCLDKIFGGDKELMEYVQLICGLCLIGKVFVEACIIAYGDGGNGKSTFFNAIAHVIGDYYGSLSADALTVGCKRNIQPELAEMRGKRLIIAAESQEGARLDESTIKRMCSTDEIAACKKFKDPFNFKPSHTLVLYTNHLPKVSANDEGTWRRLIVIPFKNKLTGTGDIKNYSDILVEKAGEYIMLWLIQGAKKVIDLAYNIKAPTCVTEAIEEYREQNNWFNHFLNDRCDTSDPKAESGSGDLYSAYRNYATSCNEFVKSTTDFYAALEKAGFKRVNRHNKRYFRGIKLIAADGDFEDILT